MTSDFRSYMSGRPEIHNYRIAIDTGAEETGYLTAFVVGEEAAGSFMRTSVSAFGKIEIENVHPEDLRCEEPLEEPSIFSLLKQVV
ncbi:hypothetical protein [Rhizobium ruizarguesonis]|uniref:hypothetical protein n=1 Tax=Rhizobium ruizarguesonis TaxID=2081791 RepID=UPI0010325270|nr:hypothetical protein [Rhizobium ruizarguesonis]TBA63796.1 hypothetical protein ELH57_08905 [Rhizobium ruizarguesonis]